MARNRHEYQARYYQENKTAISEQRKRFYKANRQKITAKQRRDYRSHPVRFKNYRLKSRYGISIAEFDRILASQDGKCAICGEKKPDLVVDHSHEDNSVRGILCGTCNTGLGMLGDSIQTLKSAIRYLARAQRAKDGRDSNQRNKRSRL